MIKISILSSFEWIAKAFKDYRFITRLPPRTPMEQIYLLSSAEVY